MTDLIQAATHRPRKTAPPLAAEIPAIDPGIATLRAKRGRVAYLSRLLGIDRRSIATWRRIPLYHVFQIAKAISVPPEDLRPDFFMNDPLRRERVKPELLASALLPKPKGWHRGVKKERA